MRQEDLGSWLEDSLGTRDASRLLDDDDMAQQLRRSRTDIEETLRSRKKRLALRKKQLEGVLRDAEDLDGTERSRTLAKAKAIKEQYERVESSAHESCVRLTAILAVQTLRELDGDTPESAAVDAIRDAYDDSPLPGTFFGAYLGIVAATLELDELLSRIDPLPSPFDSASEPPGEDVPTERISIDASPDLDPDTDIDLDVDLDDPVGDTERS